MTTNTALLIIDIQVGMFTDALLVYKGDELLTKIGNLLTRARDAGVLVIYVQHNGEKDDPDEPGTPGWQIHPAIAPCECDVIVQKSTPDSFYQTTLGQELTRRGIQNLVIAGMQTELCVDTTCRQAFSQGYHVTLIKDAHSTFDSLLLPAEQIIAHHNSILEAFAELREASEMTF